MITLNDLVTQTHKKLTEGNFKFLLREQVQEIVGSTDIAKWLGSESLSIPMSGLMVLKIAMRGHKWISHDSSYKEFEYQRTLGPGINGWIADNSTGKSTILKAIQWALTGTKPVFKSDVQKWIEEIAVEIRVSGEQYTIYYQLADGKLTGGGIFKEPLESVWAEIKPLPETPFLNPNAAKQRVAEFLGEKLGFTPLERAIWQKYAIDIKVTTLSWDSYALALFINDDDYRDYFFPPLQKDRSNLRQRALGIYLGLDLLKALSTLEVARDHARTDYNFESKRINTDEQGLQNEIEHFSNELSRVEERLHHIESGSSALIDVTYVSEIGKKISEYTKQIVDLNKRKVELSAEEQQINTNIANTERACQALQEAISFKVFLSGLEVEKCPHCENSIPSIPVQEEVQQGQCHVCKNQLQSVTAVESHQSMLESQKRVLEQLKKDRNNTTRELRKIETMLEEVRKEIEPYKAEFEDLARQQKVGLTEEMCILLNKQGYLRGQLEQLQSRTKAAKATYLQDKKLKFEILKTSMGILQSVLTQENQNVLALLMEQVTSMAQAFGVRNLSKVELDDSFTMLVTQSQGTARFEEMNFGERLRLKLAFHLALLNLRIHQDIGRHPKFLLMDAPGSAEMSDEDFVAILKQIADIQKAFGDQVQILLATTRPEFRDYCNPENLELLSFGETCF